MLVSYTYQSDEPPEDDGDPKSSSGVKAVPEKKTLSFYTAVNLGATVIRDERMPHVGFELQYSNKAWTVLSICVCSRRAIVLP